MADFSNVSPLQMLMQPQVRTDVWNPAQNIIAAQQAYRMSPNQQTFEALQRAIDAQMRQPPNSTTYGR